MPAKKKEEQKAMDLGDITVKANDDTINTPTARKPMDLGNITVRANDDSVNPPVPTNPSPTTGPMDLGNITVKANDDTVNAPTHERLQHQQHIASIIGAPNYMDADLEAQYPSSSSALANGLPNLPIQPGGTQPQPQGMSGGPPAPPVVEQPSSRPTLPIGSNFAPVRTLGPATSNLSDKDYAAGLIGTQDQRRAAIFRSANAESQGAVDTAQVQEDEAKRQRASIEQDRINQAKIMDDVRKRDEQLRGMIQKAHPAIDPNRWWNRKDTGERMVAGLGILFSGMGQGLSKSNTNMAMSAIESNINRDIDAQKGDIDNNFKAVSAMHNLNNDSFTREIHNQAWRDKYLTAGLEVAKLQVNSIAARTQSETVKANADKLSAEIDDRQMEIRNQMYKAAQAAAGAAAAARQREISAARTELYSLIDKGYSPDEASEIVSRTRPGVPFDQQSPAQGRLLNAQSELHSKQEELAKAFHKPFAELPAAIQSGIRQSALESLSGDPSSAYSTALHPPAIEGLKEKEALLKAGDGAKELQKERMKAQTELNAQLANISDYEKRVKEITAGGRLGAIGNFFGPGEGRENIVHRESYNNQVRVIIGGAYKLGTGANEPKNMELIKAYAEPYEITASDDEHSARVKMSGLKEFLVRQAAAQGAGAPPGTLPPAPTAATPASGGYFVGPGGMAVPRAPQGQAPAPRSFTFTPSKP